MNKDEDIIFTIKTIPVVQYLIRILCLAWIAFAYSNYNVNPDFFLITIVIAIIIILVLYNRFIIARNDYFEIIRSSWIPMLNKTEKYYYSEIFDIKFNRWIFSDFFLHIGLFDSLRFKYFGYSSLITNAPPKIVLETTDHSFIYLTPVGGYEEIEEFIKKVKSRINK